MKKRTKTPRSCPDLAGDIRTAVTPLGNGRYGARILSPDGQRVLAEDNDGVDRADAGRRLKELLRGHDKMGGMSKMASASRDRRG